MKHIILTIFFGTILAAQGQNNDITYHQAPNTTKSTPKKAEKKNFLEHISIGGTGGLQVGTATYIELSPNVSYHFNKFFSAGVGGSYYFFHDSRNKYSSHVFGPRVFAEAHFFNYLGLHASYQAINYESLTPTIANPRIWSHHITAGGGYYQRAGRVALYFYVLYNWSDRPLSETIYRSPIVLKTGFSVFLK